MHCSSFEPLLDAYLDGDLLPARAAQVAAHAESCDRCGAMLTELRAIDGLLIEPRRLEPAPNFTFAVMAEARTLPAPHVHRMPHLAVLGTYVVFGWVAIATFLVTGGAAARATVATMANYATHVERSLVGLTAITGHVFGSASFDVTAAMGAAIAFDLVAVALLASLYALRRARRAALGVSE